MVRIASLRWVILSAALALSACGGGGNNSEGSGADKGDGSDSGQGGGDELSLDGAVEGDAGSQEADSGSDGGRNNACKTACDPDDCGEYVSNNCGGHLNCGVACPEGQGCGLQRPDKCDFPPPVTCTAKDPVVACAGKCGKIENGCSDGIIDCDALGLGVMCAADEVCGGTPQTERKPNQCVKIPAVECEPLTCQKLFEQLAQEKGRTAPLECGTISDGCGGTVDCAQESGGCQAGEVCKFGDYMNDPQANSCIEPVVTCTPDSQGSICAGKCGIVIESKCGTPVNCGNTCSAGETCEANACVSGPVCPAKTAAQVCPGKCGFVSDGCGGGYDCSAPANVALGGVACNGNAGEWCSGGGIESVCGKPACQVLPQFQQPGVCAPVNGHKSCKKVTDNCGNFIDCGGCATGEVCGANGMPDLCSAPILTCTPIPQATACRNKCGKVSDGCGGNGFYDCNGTNGGVTCTAPEYCGSANGQTNQCVSPVVTCTPKTCQQLGHSCGLASDGCGHQINCWPGCAPNDLSCTRSCASGSACISNQTSGSQSCVQGGPTCVGSLCNSLPGNCSAASPTRLKGTVRTPGRQVNGGWRNQLPVPNAIVYIPASPTTALPSVFEGVQAGNPASCGRCEDEKLVADGQSVLAAAVTNYKGEFTLEGRIPVGVPFRVVIKVGKWRRVVEIPNNVVASCQERTLTTEQTRLPAHATDGFSGTHLPKIAISTGNVDEMECVFRSMGFADSEFTPPTGNGRLHMYRANGARMGPRVCTGNYSWFGQSISCSASNNYGCNNNRQGCAWTDQSVGDTALFQNPSRLDDYDLVVWDCEGEELRHDTYAPNIEAYVNAGGRMFASHYSYVWIERNGTLDASAAWEASGSADSATGYVSMPSGTTQRTRANAVKSPLFRDWLSWQGALDGTTAGSSTIPTTPRFTIADPRDRAGATVGASTDEWVYRTVGNNNAARVQQLSFNTPYGASAANICGRVAYSGFHVANATSNHDEYFPAICGDGELSAQEKILAFMLFDLATCVSQGDPPAPPACTPKTVADVCPTENAACGYLPDGCGGTINCGGCAAGNYCDGTACKPQQCTPATCSSLGFNCGLHADGCGGIARNSQGVEGCGECVGGQVCGLGGPGLCGGTNCTPIPSNVACAGKNCGTVSNGCGGTYECGTCPSGQVCGANGPNVCGDGNCTQIPKETACAGKDCGLVSDGCGGSYECGTCVAPKSCGGGGNANQCGQPQCTPKTKADACAGKQCGWVSDGCGGAIQCGTCPDGGVCGGAGPNQCGSSCTPTTCIDEGAQCGAISDECGGVLNCGSCPPNAPICGANGPNKCGSTACVPRTCAQAGAECGLVGDGCNGVLDCGTCTAPGQTCGGAGVPNQCGTGTGGCNKLTCASQGVQCGATSDGCGGLLDCGGCEVGAFCSQGMCQALPPILQ